MSNSKTLTPTEDLRELVASGEFTLGPYVEKFERKFAAYIGVKHDQHEYGYGWDSRPQVPRHSSGDEVTP